MTTVPDTSRIPVGAVLLAGLGAQFADDVVFFLLPPAAILTPLTGLLAILLTAGAARVVARRHVGPAVARTGLAVGAASAVLGLLVGGLGLVAVLLAIVTMVAGVAGAVTGRGGPRSIG